MIWNIRKQKSTNQKKKKKKEPQKYEDSISSLWDKFKSPTFASQGCQKEKRDSKTLEIYWKK